MLCGGWSKGQIASQANLQTQSGYEFNIFKFPESFFNSDTNTLMEKDEIYRSSFFQQTSARVLFTKKMGRKGNISLRLQPRARFYFEDSALDYYTIYSRLRYQNTFRRNTKWEIIGRYNFRERDGENLDDSELRTPLGYGHLELSTSLAFRLYPQHRGKLSLRYANRDYKKGLEDNLHYNLYGAHLVFRNVFRRLAGYHSYGLELDVSRRIYERVFTDPTESIEERDWSYAQVDGFYRYPISKTWQLRSGFAWGNRKDKNEDKFSYTEIRPSLHLSYKGKRFSMNFTGSYTARNFKVLRANDSEGNDLGLLKFDYTRLQLKAEHQLSDQLVMTFNGYINNRDSNRTNVNKLFFRSYDYYYTAVGLRFDF